MHGPSLIETGQIVSLLQSGRRLWRDRACMHALMRLLGHARGRCHRTPHAAAAAAAPSRAMMQSAPARLHALALYSLAPSLPLHLSHAKDAWSCVPCTLRALSSYWMAWPSSRPVLTTGRPAGLPGSARARQRARRRPSRRTPRARLAAGRVAALPASAHACCVCKQSAKAKARALCCVRHAQGDQKAGRGRPR